MEKWSNMQMDTLFKQIVWATHVVSLFMVYERLFLTNLYFLDLYFLSSQKNTYKVNFLNKNVATNCKYWQNNDTFW